MLFQVMDRALQAVLHGDMCEACLTLFQNVFFWMRSQDSPAGRQRSETVQPGGLRLMASLPLIFPNEGS